jgi:hypothetical protein
MQNIPVVHHQSSAIYSRRPNYFPPADVVVRDRVATTREAKTVVDCARVLGTEAGVVAADGALHLGMVCKQDLQTALLDSYGSPGVNDAALALAEADALAESPFESISRFRLAQQGIPSPELQVVLLLNGKGIRVDFLWRQFRVVGEADGMTKYTDAEALRAEKRRQLIREDADFLVVRWVWDEMWRTPELVADRVRRAFDRSRSQLDAAS